MRLILALVLTLALAGGVPVWAQQSREQSGRNEIQSQAPLATALRTVGTQRPDLLMQRRPAPRPVSAKACLARIGIAVAIGSGIGAILGAKAGAAEGNRRAGARWGAVVGIPAGLGAGVAACRL